MNLKTAIAERDFRFKRYIEAQRVVDEIAKEEIRQRDLKLIDRPMKRSEVADVLGVSRSTVSRWEADCHTALQWHDYIRDHHEKYLPAFREGLGLKENQTIKKAATRKKRLSKSTHGNSMNALNTKTI